MSTRASIADEKGHSSGSPSCDSATCGALLMGSDYRALGVARSLGRRGIPVWVVRQGGHLVAAASRYVSRGISWPDGDDRRKVDFLVGICREHALNGWVLFPTDDYAVALAGRFHRVLATYYRLTVPPWEELQWSCDKRLLDCLARRHGILTPWTISPSTREELEASDCPFPVALKPATRILPTSLRIPKAWCAENRHSLLARYDEASRLIPRANLIVQEVVPGGGEAQFSYAALCRQGSSLISVVARRTRQFPRDFGQFSTFVEAVDEPGVVEPAQRLLAATGFTGIVEIEFKKDPRDGQFKVLDVNPRVWGWHTLSRRDGVDFSHLLWLLVRGEPVPEHRRSSPGRRWMHLSADLRVAAEEILYGRLSLPVYLSSFRGPRESAIFAWDDPLPGLLDLPLFAWAAGERVLRH